MIRIQYPRYGIGGEEEPFTADEIKIEINTLWMDLKCQYCGYTISLSNHNYGDEDMCPKCKNKKGEQ